MLLALVLRLAFLGWRMRRLGTAAPPVEPAAAAQLATAISSASIRMI